MKKKIITLSILIILSSLYIANLIISSQVKEILNDNSLKKIKTEFLSNNIKFDLDKKHSNCELRNIKEIYCDLKQVELSSTKDTSKVTFDLKTKNILELKNIFQNLKILKKDITDNKKLNFTSNTDINISNLVYVYDKKTLKQPVEIANININANNNINSSVIHNLDNKINIKGYNFNVLNMDMFLKEINIETSRDYTIVYDKILSLKIIPINKIDNISDLMTFYTNTKQHPKKINWELKINGNLEELENYLRKDSFFANNNKLSLILKSYFDKIKSISKKDLKENYKTQEDNIIKYIKEYSGFDIDKKNLNIFINYLSNEKRDLNVIVKNNNILIN